ncbi:sigma factor-like helix-turn-helix DNA-binding protein, partial [Listeria monocytogenes]|uniref:sigma factor-like helix-turn-helix DNA-binding protein n=1 Tax=Listeria monocytogenes TaxID=1639 RepID=UPI001AC90936
PQAIDRLLDGLSGQARAVFLISQLEGLTYVQIGERLGLSLGRIHQLMKDALYCCYRGFQE